MARQEGGSRWREITKELISCNTYGLIECRSVNFCGINYEGHVDLLLLCVVARREQLREQGRTKQEKLFLLLVRMLTNVI